MGGWGLERGRKGERLEVTEEGGKDWGALRLNLEEWVVLVGVGHNNGMGERVLYEVGDINTCGS